MKIKLKKEEFTRARVNKGWTIVDVAKNVGISKQAMYQIVGEKNYASPKTAKTVAEVLEVDVEKIFVFVDE